MISTEFLQERKDNRTKVSFVMSNGSFFEAKIKEIDTESVLIIQDMLSPPPDKWVRDVLVQRAYIVSVVDCNERKIG